MMAKLRQWLPDWKQFLKIVGYVVLLYALQMLLIIPAVTYFISSDFNSVPDISFEPVAGEIEQAAILECNEFFREQYTSEQVEFLDQSHKVWKIGDSRYLVKASAIVPASLGLAEKINFTCYMKYLGDDSFSKSSWKLKGLDYRFQSNTE